MKYIIILVLVTSFTNAPAQCKSYRLANNGDTLNCIDQKDRRQGKWIVSVDGVRGEPGYDEEGTYVDGKKEGVWRVYTAMGDLYAVERYRWGNRDGKSQYYNIGGILREESWKAVNPDNPYDTVDVPDPVNQYKVDRVVVKMEGSAIKNGTWTFYESGSGGILKTETYLMGKLQDPMKAFATQSSAANGKEAAASIDSTLDDIVPPKKVKPKEVMQFEKKTGKKKVKVIDGSTF